MQEQWRAHKSHRVTLPLRLVRAVSESNLCVGCRRRLIRSTFFPVEKHEVCRVDLFPVTPTNHVPYTTMISTDDVQCGCGWVRVVMNETHLSVFHFVWKSRSRKALEKQCLFRGSLCFQLIVLVSSKRLYNIHVT